MPDETVLRAKAREVIRTGKLPSRRPDQSTRGVLPMELQVGDRFADETGEWEVVGWPFTTAGGKNAHARVRKVSQPGLTDLPTWGAHERIAVKRTGAEGRGQGRMTLAIVLAGLMVAGCVSLSSRYATRPPQGRSASEISQDEAQCEEYAKHQVKHQGDHYRVCMVSGFYAANVDMDEVSWTIGVTQTRPHEPGEVMKDMLECDRRADDAKKSDAVPPSSLQQQSVIASQAHATAGWSGEPYLHRPNATRMLVFCLQERGYKVVPRVPR